MLSCAILTYHSQNIRGNSQALNDHIALSENLLALHRAGYRIIPLARMMDWLGDEAEEPLPKRAVALTFDDGCDFDVKDLDYPGHGVQSAFSRILSDFITAHGASAQPELQATSFVIASSEARRIIDAGSLFGQGWISDGWWRETDAAGLIAIESHGWDHNHPDLAGQSRGNFHTVDTHEQCLEQVVRAAASIESITGRWPQFFAYPFGQSSAYI
ncbi:MAG: polysaccharide deacetylase family protein, partial [Lysobacterales bacterium]